MNKLFCGICLALLLSSNVWAGDVKPVEVEVLAKTGSSWDGRELPDYPNGKPEVTILRIIIQPGVELPLHKHPVINAGVLLRGELTVVTEDNENITYEKPAILLWRLLTSGIMERMKAMCRRKL